MSNKKLDLWFTYFNSVQYNPAGARHALPLFTGHRPLLPDNPVHFMISYFDPPEINP
jgi:hypothetical protein